MDTVLNTIIILFWSAFFLATILSLFMGLRHSFRKDKTETPLHKPKAQGLQTHST